MRQRKTKQQKQGEFKDKISLDNTIYKKLSDQKKSMESMIKMLDGLINRYTKDKRFEEDETGKDIIKYIPKRAAELVARITKTIVIIKLHAV